VVKETPELYNLGTSKFVANLFESSHAWIWAIFEGKKEVDRVLHVDNDLEWGFVVVPDFKMDMGSPKQSLYLQCIARNPLLRCVRDLGARHLPLLERMRDKVMEIVWQRFGVAANQLQLYIHYFPTFYQLHLHVVSLSSAAATQGGMAVGKAILLEDVLQNLRLRGDYYALATLTGTVKVGTSHFEALLAAGLTP